MPNIFKWGDIMDNFKVYVGKVLKEIRRIRGISAEEIAQKYGIHEQSIYAYERGDYLPKSENLRKLCRALLIDPMKFNRLISESEEIISRAQMNIPDASPDLVANIESSISVQYQEPQDKAVEIINNGTSDDPNEVDTVDFLQDKRFPIISDAAAAEVNTLYFPLADYANENAEEMQYFQDGQPGDFVIRVSGNSMSPWYPPGTLLLIRPNQRLQNGQRVIAILENGEVLFKIFAGKGNKFGLFSINQADGKNYTFPPHKANEVRGLYQVIASVRNEDRLDREMAARGIRHGWQDALEKL